MAAHLNEMPDEVARAVEALDARAQARAEGVDVPALAERVLARLREPQVRVVPLWRRPGLRAAAALALALASAVVVREATRGPARTAAWLPVPVELRLDSLASGEAEALLAAVEAARNGEAVRPAVLTLEDLSEAELRALLQAMESVEGVL
jgi:hypothetical protein